MRRHKQATIERKCRDGEWEAMTDVFGKGIFFVEIRDCRTGRRFMVEVI